MPQWRFGLARRAQEPRPAGARPRPRRRVSGWRNAPRWPRWPATILHGHGARPVPGDQRQQGHPPVRRAGRHADLRRGVRVRPRTGPGARGGPPRPRRQRHEEDAARRARCSSTGARTTAPRPPSRRTRCAAGSAPDGGGAAHLGRTRRPDAAPLEFHEVLELRRAGRIRSPVSGGRRRLARASRRATTGQRTPARAAGDGGDTDPRLDKYRSKRDGDRTPEPVPADRHTPTTRRDDGTRSSSRSTTPAGCTTTSGWSATACWCRWAVPKGVPTEPRQNHLAVQTEDHPLDYADFAGDIPRASTAAARSRIWDAGTLRTARNGATARRSSPPCTARRTAASAEPRRFALIHTGRARRQEWLIHLMDPAGPQGRPGPRRPAGTGTNGERHRRGSGRRRGGRLSGRPRPRRGRSGNRRRHRTCPRRLRIQPDAGHIRDPGGPSGPGLADRAQVGRGAGPGDRRRNDRSGSSAATASTCQ